LLRVSKGVVKKMPIFAIFHNDSFISSSQVWLQSYTLSVMKLKDEAGVNIFLFGQPMQIIRGVPAVISKQKLSIMRTVHGAVGLKTANKRSLPLETFCEVIFTSFWKVVLVLRKPPKLYTNFYLFTHSFPHVHNKSFVYPATSFDLMTKCLLK